MSRVIRTAGGHDDLTDTQALEMLAKTNRLCFRAKPDERGVNALLTSEHNRRCRAQNVDRCARTDESCAKVASSGVVDNKNIEAGKLSHSGYLPGAMRSRFR